MKTINKNRMKRKDPLVSVIMPVYNAEKYLEKAIDSILSQTYKNFELIIIDDMSQDRSIYIIRSYKRRYPAKITVIQTDKNLNRGGDMCANLGIDRARGKYIARMDASHIALPKKLEKQVAFMEKHPKVFLVGSNAYAIDSKGRAAGEKLKPSNIHEIYKSYATLNPIIHSTVLIRKIFEGKKFSYQVNYPANNDYYTFFKLICRGYILVNLEEKLLYYRIHDNNDTFSDIKEKFVNNIKIRLEMVTSYNYRPQVLDIAANIAQSVVLLPLPEATVRKLYFITKGVIKVEFNASTLARLVQEYILSPIHLRYNGLVK